MGDYVYWRKKGAFAAGTAKDIGKSVAGLAKGGADDILVGCSENGLVCCSEYSLYVLDKRTIETKSKAEVFIDPRLIFAVVSLGSLESKISDAFDKTPHQNARIVKTKKKQWAIYLGSKDEALETSWGTPTRFV